MSSITAPDGTTHVVERRLPRLSWEARIRDTGDLVDFYDPFAFVDDLASLALLPVILVLGLLLALLVPVLVFVLELALIVAVVVPLALLAIALGVRAHEVVLVRSSDRRLIGQRRVRGPIASWRAGRELAGLARDGTLPPAEVFPTTPADRGR